ncbi:hypothetical protein QBC43DRAFT_9151 [Cladorrhinum sp. PSN259]|nr:hypothetical protein QBC43DRAFT_9151 [Cladorrhinum sp. PSN259]
MANHYPYHDPIPVQDQGTVGMEVFRGFPNQPPIPLSPYSKPPETPYKYHYDPPFEREPLPQVHRHLSVEQQDKLPQHLQHTLSESPESEISKELLPNHHHSEPPEKRILGIRISILLFIITGLLILVIAALGLVGGLLASEIKALESSIPSSTGTNTSTGTDSAPAAITTNIEVPNYRYVGCFVDDLERVLSSVQKTDAKLTNQGCAGFCVGNKYFGTEAGMSCYCGQSIPTRVVKANEWDCNMQCEGRKGNRAETCGGSFYISIWERQD